MLSFAGFGYKLLDTSSFATLITSTICSAAVRAASVPHVGLITTIASTSYPSADPPKDLAAERSVTRMY